MADQALVLHGLAIKKHATAADVAGILGLEEAEVAEVLTAAASTGQVVEAQGKYMLAPAARIMLEGEYSRLFADQRSDQGFIEAYERFEVINKDLKQLITDWQTMDVGGQKVPNDHSDKDYDAKIIDRLGDFHERAEAVLDGLARGLARMGVYKAKLLAALEKAEDGDIEWVSDARLESYHTVWFELHEDLLRIMDRERDE